MTEEQQVNKKKSETLVLFDVGGVLLKLNYLGLYRKGAKLTKTTPTEFKERYINSRIEPRVLSGEISHSQYLQEFRILLRNESLTEGQLAKIMRNAWGDEISETIELKKQIAESGYSVGLFSNMNKFAIDILSKEFPDMFETYNTGPRIYSYWVGAIKPNPLMYQEVQGMGFKSVVYIDDNRGYVKTGVEKFGWNGILFTPHVDNAEAIRAIPIYSDKKTKKGSNFKIAKSVQELKEALNYFGIKIN